MPDAPERHAVRCFVRHQGEIFVVQRGEAWDAVSGSFEADPEKAARKLVGNIFGSAAELICEGNLLFIPGESENQYIYPFLFDCATREAVRFSAPYEWIAPTDLLQRSTAPELWASYAEVAPSVESIQRDRRHGASYLSVRALEVLRDWAGRLSWQQQRGKRLSEEKLRNTIFQLADRLIRARPSMAVLRNRINRVMVQVDGDISSVAALAHEAIRQASEADSDAAQRAAQLVSGQNVLTFSFSESVVSALAQCRPASTVFVPQSKPGGEGAVTARKLAASGCEVTILPDAAIASLLAQGRVDIILTGADTALPDGRVINKTGTHLAALAGSAYEIPVYALCSTDKISTSEQVSMEETASGPLYKGSANISEFNPLFEIVPAHLIAGIITEKGILTTETLEDMAQSLAKLGDWQKA